MPGVVGSLIGIGGMIGGTINKNKTANKQMDMANAINPEWKKYQTSQYAQNRLGMAQQMFNGRMAGAADMERNIAANGANALSNINRNASDSSQALAAAAGAQGQTNDAYNNLAIQENKNKYSLLDNLNSGYDAMIKEGDKDYDSMMQKYGMDMGQKNSLMGASWQNKAGMWNDIASGGFGLKKLQSDKMKAAMSMFGGK